MNDSRLPSSRVAMFAAKAQADRIADGLDIAIKRVRDHGRFILGPEVQEFERRLADLTGAGHAVTCDSGTGALTLTLMALSIGPGDAVFVPAFTFAATASAVARVGATPFFVDIGEDRFDMCAESLSQAIDQVQSDGTLRPAAIIPVDLFGHPADYPAIDAVARGHGVPVVADAAQSLGAALSGRAVGTLAMMTAVSFFPTKPLGCFGDGGAVLTDDASLADLLRSLRAHGRGADKYENERIGINSRLDTLQAAILLEKLTIFESEIATRRELAERYDEGLSDKVVRPRTSPAAEPVWAQYTIRAGDRNALRQTLSDSDIESAVYYPKPLTMQRAFQDFPVAPKGVANSITAAKSVLSIPLHPYLSETEQDHVIDAINATVG